MSYTISDGKASMLEKNWRRTLEDIKTKVSAATFNTLFSELFPLTVHNDTLLLSVPNDFVKGWLEKRYLSLISKSVKKFFGDSYSVSLLTSERKTKLDQKPLLPVNDFNDRRSECPFNPKHTFESFIVGNSNRFAYAASVAVAEDPGSVYNPLFLYGGVGLGKTHLLHAISNYVYQNHVKLKVTYVTSERFTNDFINAVREKSIVYFQKKYRESDILLIDDIQFLQGKEQTQEEFFHTFNSLYEAGKQIVISSDRPPHKLSALEDRLRSRFEMGLMTDIQPPDLETRVAILLKKAEYQKVTISEEVAVAIAERITSNIRELEGALNKLVAYSRLEGKPPTLQLVNELLNEGFPEKSRKPVSINEVQNVICSYFGISKADLIGNKRSAALVYPRQIAMYLCRELTDESLSNIGKHFGGRDHTTVLHACKKVEKMMKEKRETFNQLNELTMLIKNKD